MSHVIVIGGGIGGLATALRLVKSGFSVALYEKEATVGGKINRLERNGFVFDTTASLLMTPKNYWDVLESRQHFSLQLCDPLYRVFYFNKKKLDVPAALPKLLRIFDDIEENGGEKLLQFLSESISDYTKTKKHFLEKSMSHWYDLFNPQTLLNGLQTNPFKSAAKWIAHYFESEELQHFLLFQVFYMGISPYDAPKMFGMIPALILQYGLWQSENGMYDFITDMEREFKEKGGTIYTNHTVQEIAYDEHGTTGIVINNDTITADYVVCNVDFPLATETLFHEEHMKKKHGENEWKKNEFTCSTFIAHLGIKGALPQFAVHNLFINRDFQENISCVFKGDLPLHPSLYIYHPGAMTKQMAPLGYESINVMMRVPNLLTAPLKWDDTLTTLMKERLLQELSQIEGLADVRNRIVFEHYSTPVTMETKFSSYGGAAFGLAPTLDHLTYFRPHNVSPVLPNLFFVGSSVHPGNGASVVLQGAKIVAEEIQKVEAARLQSEE